MKQKDFMIIMIPTVLLIVVWVILNIYRSAASSTIETPLSFEIASIDSTFDTKTIEKLKERKAISPIYEIVEQQSTQSATSIILPQNREL